MEQRSDTSLLHIQVVWKSKITLDVCFHQNFSNLKLFGLFSGLPLGKANMTVDLSSFYASFILVKLNDSLV